MNPIIDNVFYNKRNLFHVVGHCEFDAWPALTQKEVWKLFSRVLRDIHKEGPLVTHAFVLMNNHYHWICSNDEDNKSSLFEWFHESVAVAFLHTTQTYLGGIFRGNPHITLLDRHCVYKNAYRYAYRNPLEVGLVQSSEDYPFSTLGYLLRGKKLPFPCIDNMNLNVDPITILRWINEGNDLESLH